jgi:hypothetical protein
LFTNARRITASSRRSLILAIPLATRAASELAMPMKRKTGRARIEDRAQTIEAKKPWLKLGMSRRTWYRRQAEQRKGRE